MALKIVFQFKDLYFWNQSIFFNETFRRPPSLSFHENEAILDGRVNCLMPATPIFQKHCFFEKCPKNLTNFYFFEQKSKKNFKDHALAENFTNCTAIYSRGKKDTHPLISWFTFWTVQPKPLRVWEQTIYHWKAL